MRRRVYIAGPISKGDMLHNVRQADAAFLALLRAGFAPMCPHWSVYHGSACRPINREGAPVVATADAKPNGTTHEDWMGVDLPWVAVSDAVLRLPGESTGADLEVAEAITRDIPVFTTVEALVEYFRPVMVVIEDDGEPDLDPADRPTF